MELHITLLAAKCPPELASAIITQMDILQSQLTSERERSDSLQAVVDAAKAQEPVLEIETYGYSNGVKCSRLPVGMKLYAAPVPAQPVSVPEALAVLSSAMQSDPDFAWSWHCNVAMTAQDAGAPHDKSNVWAANFMQRAFGVDTLTRVKSEIATQQPAGGAE